MPIYLRVEAQNLGNTLEDTDQLSVIRGGSLMLRNAIRSMEKALAAFVPRVVRIGGEAAIFELTQGEANDALKCARASLAANAPHFTFAVSAVQAQDDASGMDAALAAVRWHQPRRPRLAFNGFAGSSNGEICELTRVRAATAESNHPRIKRWSLSAWDRYQHGRDQKREAFYMVEADPKVAHGLVFVDDLEGLTGSSPYPTLDGKMAVLSIDGNSFGAIARSMSQKDTPVFDEHIKGLRRAMLTAVLEHLCEPNTLPNERCLGKRLRLEVLMWSGDEFKLMLPAWLGVPVLQLLFGVVSKWPVLQAPLTLSAGLLLCPHTLPIHQAFRIADQLQYRAKDALTKAAKAGGPLVNCWDYLVLESLDYPAARDLDEFWARRFVTPDTARGNTTRIGPSPLLACPDFPAARDELKKALDEADSRRKVYASAQMLADPNVAHHDETKKWQEQPEAEAILAALHALLPPLTGNWETRWPPDPAWLHLRELWDYVLPKRSQNSQSQAQEHRQ